MKKSFCLAAAIAVSAMATGCASITGTNMQSVSVKTTDKGGEEVSGASCALTNNKGKWFVTTPGSVTVQRSNDDMQVLCEKNGSQPGRAAVVSETKGAMFGNILFGGGIGAVIDHNSGAAYEYPIFLAVSMGDMVRIEKPKQPAPSAAGAVSTTSSQAGAPSK